MILFFQGYLYLTALVLFSYATVQRPPCFTIDCINWVMNGTISAEDSWNCIRVTTRFFVTYFITAWSLMQFSCKVGSKKVTMSSNFMIIETTVLRWTVKVWLNYLHSATDLSRVYPTSSPSSWDWLQTRLDWQSGIPGNTSGQQCCSQPTVIGPKDMLMGQYNFFYLINIIKQATLHELFRMPNYTGHCAPDLQALTGAHSMIFIFLVTYHCVYIPGGNDTKKKSWSC